MSNRTLRLALAALAIGTCIPAQTPPAPAFAAASVKPNHSADMRGLGIQFLPGGRLRIQNTPLLFIIAAAYGVPFQSTRLSGVPDWARGERFDIEAEAGPGTMPAGVSRLEIAARMRAMLRTLLLERFQLKVRSELKDEPAYAIVVAKDGPKLKPVGIEEKDCDTDAAKGVACHQFNGGRGRGLHAKACSIADLALFVSNWTDRPLVDKTGLTGLFQFDTRGWADMRPGPPPPPGTVAEDGQDAASLPTVFSLFSEMGLKLEAQRAPLEMYTVENVERPSQN